MIRPLDLYLHNTNSGDWIAYMYEERSPFPFMPVFASTFESHGWRFNFYEGEARYIIYLSCSTTKGDRLWETEFRHPPRLILKK